MNRKDRLYNDYEDALFALLMDEVAQEEGARLLEENERLKNDPDAAVPPELDKKSLETIRRTLAGQRRHTHTVGWYLGRLAIAILAALLLFAVAYATIPSVQLRTLEMLIENSDVSSRLSFAFGENDNESAGVEEGKTLAGYTLPELSRQYAVAEQGETSREAWIEYAHANGSVIRIDVTSFGDTFLDNEAAEDYEDIEIRGFPGKAYYDKAGAVYVSWYDTDHEKVITLYADGINKEMARSYAEQMSYAG